MSKSRRTATLAGVEDDPEADWAGKIDKNPFYRTMDIFNGMFHKNVKLMAGSLNATDLQTIYLNFGEMKPEKLVDIVGPGRLPDRQIYQLECGHQWEGRILNRSGAAKQLGLDTGMCSICGAEQVYRAFEHEWGHIIFKSDLVARKVFCVQYATQILRNHPSGQELREPLVNFLAMVVNAFDDIRINSLWEKVYPGSAAAIWERWRNFTIRAGEAINQNFLAYIFATAFDIPTSPNSPFHEFKPIIEWATKRVRYRGHANMLIDVRVVIDRAIGTILAQFDRAASSFKLSVSAEQGKSYDDENNQEEDGGEGRRVAGDDPQSGQQEAHGQGTEEQGKAWDNGGHDDGKGSPQVGPDSLPSYAATGGRYGGVELALRALMAGAKEVDPREKHPEPETQDALAIKESQTMRALMHKVLNSDISDLEKLAAPDPDGCVDKDMADQLANFQPKQDPPSETSQLTGNAKARVLIIPVTASGTPNEERIILTSEEKHSVARIKAVFSRSMGRQRARRSASGTAVDVQALIDYMMDQQDPNVFEISDLNQGFAYSTLCDMSGSTVGIFREICHAAEMLKQSLSFPFVEGNMWGYRGGERVSGRIVQSPDSEVWIYRYAKDVRWYRGSVPMKFGNAPYVVDMPVQCGGMTPMNAAIHVVATHMWKRLPAGMVKRMFLLTDGSPAQYKANGTAIPDHVLRRFVAHEIAEARKHGVQVYTLIIGAHAIPDEQCFQMFGPTKYWKKVNRDKAGPALYTMALQNFSKYLRARG